MEATHPLGVARRTCNLVLSAWLLALWVVQSVLAAAPSGQPAGSLSVVCDFAVPQFETMGQDARVTVPGCEVSRQVGAPVLPYRTVRLVLPADSQVSGLEVQSELPPIDQPGFWRIEHATAPSPTPTATPEGKSLLATSPSSDAPDPTIYLSDAVYPAVPAEIASVQRMGGYDIAFIRVYPVGYRPLSGRLITQARVRVTVNLAARNTTMEAPLRSRGRAATRQRVMEVVENPETLEPVLSAASPGNAPVFDYLLITKSNLVTAFQPLLDQKILDGLAVKVMTVETITNSYPGRDVAEKIRNGIRYAYTNWGITYVLLGGDTATVPTRYGYAYMGSLTFDYQVPTDLYYACLDGSWDHNGNNIFGEPTDGETGGEIDLLAEVFVGRAPVDTAAEVGLFVQKTLRYETQAHPHRTNVLFMAEYLTGSATSQGWNMFVPLLPIFTNTYQIARLDDAPWTTPQWGRTEAIAALNTSPHLALFNGHGDTDAMMRLYTEDLVEVTNQWPFLTYSVGCNAGEFDNDKFSPDCIGEELLKGSAHGSFAAVLNSRLGWYDPTNEWRWSGEFQVEFFRQLLTNGNNRLGVANQLSKHALISRVETSGLMTYRWCYFEITLFGDPHVAWQTAPALVQLNVASAHGGATPPVGANSFAPGSMVNCAVTNSPLPGGSGIQYVCTGWSGAGSVPATGSFTQASFTITTDSQIAWLWKTQAWFSASASGGGFVTTTDGWRDLGSTLVIQAVASNYFHFTGWSGDVPAGAESNATLNLSTTRPRTLLAMFAENLTSTGTPEWWLASHGWTNEFEAAALADSDADGMPAWAEYVAGTSPVDAASNLRLTVTIAPGPGSARVLQWPSVPDRWYSVFRADWVDGEFSELTNGLPATAPSNTFTDAEGGLSNRFYRLEVRGRP